MPDLRAQQPQNKAELLDHLEDCRVKTSGVLENLSPNLIVYEDGHWRVRDLVAHITSWNLEGVRGLRAALKGEQYRISGWNGLDDYNRRMVEAAHHASQAQVYGDYEAAHIQLRGLVRKVPDEKLETMFLFPWGAPGSVITLITGLVHHEGTHRVDLENLLGYKLIRL
ncbi:MAG: ClbS/DfsB family four-helix bundle protein [Chloroflexi bacterium]|nr:ClbS/DfsB family four-helix bundle protein [Chloroflexota bacterium]